MKRKKTMPSSREIKPPSDETRSNNGDKRTRSASWSYTRHIALLQPNQDTHSASSSPRDTGSVPSSAGEDKGKRKLTPQEEKQIEEMPIGEDGKRAKKQIVLSDRATPEKPGLYGGMRRGSDAGASSSDGSSLAERLEKRAEKRRLEQLVMKEVDEVLGNARVGIDSQDCKNLDKLAKDLGVRTVVEALKKKFETERHQSIIQAIMHLGNPEMDLPFLEEAFIKEGCKDKWVGPPPGLERTTEAMAKFGGKEALPAIEMVFRHYENQGSISFDLVDIIADLKGECIYRQGSSVFKKEKG
jgi:hypothetical protein